MHIVTEANSVCLFSSRRVEYRTARAVDEGEQLCITYIPEGMPRSARQDRLAFAYGFDCKCDLCREEIELI